MLQRITLLGGRDKDGVPEPVGRVDIERGEIFSVLGFTGSGKSQLISDMEQMAQGDTLSGRRILIDGREPDYGTRYNPDAKIVAQLSQNMNFALEMGVGDFLLMHGESRGLDLKGGDLAGIMDCVNSLAGEKVSEADILTRLSGGQSRALMIADVALISDSPVILIDEVENAGIDKRKAMELLSGQGKIVMIVTHDPQLALLGEKRIIMKNGGMAEILCRSEEEREAEITLSCYMEAILDARNKLRRGESVRREDLIL